MTDLDLRVVLDDLTADIEGPSLSDGLWEQARRRNRRRMLAVVGGTALGAAAVVVTAGLLIGKQDAHLAPAMPTTDVTQSSSLPTEPTQTFPTRPDPTAKPLTRAMIQPAWDDSRLESLPWIDSALPQTLDVVVDAPDLSADPVRYAVVAVTEEGPRKEYDLFVLGDDGGWRRVDLELDPIRDGGGYGSGVLVQSGLSPDGTKLAVPQPQSLVVVDLTTGASEKFDAPGFQTYAVWQSDNVHVLIGTQESPRGHLVDVRDGSQVEVPYSGVTAFAPDGTAVEIGSGPDFDGRLSVYRPNGSVMHTPILSAAAGINGEPPAVNGSVVTGNYDGVIRSPAKPTDVGGIVIFDWRTGEPRAILPMAGFELQTFTYELGWLDDSTVVLDLHAHGAPGQEQLLAWNYITGDLSRISAVATPLAISLAVERL